MALRTRKDIKKSSYYVWFLGAKESKGLRGKEYIIPIIDHLVVREKELEPHKVTLQVSHKGLKIIQNVLSTTKNSNKPKSEVVKHFLPHDTITCVYQDEDVVSVLLILYNPVTKCPLHCHVYRCDSVETATLLKKQLEVLIERPENQKKYEELENRLKLKIDGTKKKKKFDTNIGSCDTGISTRESTSSDEHLTPDNHNNRIATLYDSLAAELRQKLNTKQTPILLPPRDYDTVHRQKGNLQNIDLRRCLNTSIVGQNAKNGRRIESSGGSSGIGSDHAPSPEGEEGFVLDNQSTSDEEWNSEQIESSMYLIQNSSEMILPRASKHAENIKQSPEPPKSPEYHPEHRFNRYPEPEMIPPTKPEKKYYNSRYEEDQSKFPSRYEEHQRYPEKSNFFYKTSFEEEPEKKSSKDVIPRPRTSKYSEDDIRYYQEDIKTENKYYEEKTLPRGPKYGKEDPRYYPDYETKTLKAKQHNLEDPRFYSEKYYGPEEYFEDFQEGRTNTSRRYNHHLEERQHQKSSSSRSSQIPEDYFEDVPRRQKRSQHPEEYFEESRRRPEERQRSPTPPEVNVSPRDRFKDAKEKFLMMERERLEEQERLRVEENIRRRQELGHISSNLKDKTFLKRHDSMVYPKHHYQEEEGRNFGYQPKPAPRNLNYDDLREYPERDPDRNRDRDRERYHREEQPPRPSTRDTNPDVVYRRREPLDRYRAAENYDDKRRSMFTQIEEEHKTKSNEIARELKRRSYLENGYEHNNRDFMGQQQQQQQQQWDRYQNGESPNGKRKDYQFSKSSQDLDKLAEKNEQKSTKHAKKYPPGYRHSYAEPKLSGHEKLGKKLMPEMLHRTNSSVSNTGRVGIASVHPY